jgi:hypothetical protein
MAGNPLLTGTASFPLVGVVRNPAQAADQDSSVSIVGMSRNGSLYADGIHGAYFHPNIRGRVFAATAHGLTGVAPLAPAGTTAGFMFYNPAGSNVNMELLEITCLPVTATDVVGVLGIEVGGVPSAVGTAVTPVSCLQGNSSQTALCKAAYGSTIVAMTMLFFMDVFVQTTAGVMQGSVGTYRPEGKLILGPNSGANIFSTITQSTNLWNQSVVWAEWPM